MGGTAWLFNVGNKYYVTHSFEDDLCDLSISKNKFEVDELIAEQLAMLCNKGYITKYSCSGHPFSNCYYEVIEDVDAQKAIITENHVAVAKFEESALAICDMDEHLKDEIYILFEENYPFITVPNEWNYLNGKLSSPIQATNTIDFFKTVIHAVEQLNKWIEELPNNAPTSIV